jgi:hypothetical protein
VWAITSAVILPLLLSEFSEVSPWLARRLLVWAARHVGDPRKVERYREEWLAGLQDVPGKLTKLAKALSIVLYTVPTLNWQFKATVYLWPFRKIADFLLALTFPRMRRELLGKRLNHYKVEIGKPGTEKSSFTIGELEELIDVALRDALRRRVLRKSQRASSAGEFVLELDHRRRHLVLHGLRRTPGPPHPPFSSRAQNSL